LGFLSKGKLSWPKVKTRGTTAKRKSNPSLPKRVLPVPPKRSSNFTLW
jgi:hypothetical protein